MSSDPSVLTTADVAQQQNRVASLLGTCRSRAAGGTPDLAAQCKPHIVLVYHVYTWMVPISCHGPLLTVPPTVPRIGDFQVRMSS